MDWNRNLLILLLIAVRVYCVFNGIISDCDEVFNYWEPLNLILRNFGKQTWEYSPIYSIRSWAYLIPYSTLSYPFIHIFNNVNLFYFVRFLLCGFTTIAELKLFNTIYYKINKKLGYWFLLLQAINPGMSHASIALLPSSLAMNSEFFTLSYLIDYLLNDEDNNGFKIIFWYSIGGLLGWPFYLVMTLVFVAYYTAVNLIERKFLKILKFGIFAIFISSSILSLIVFIDSSLYQKFVIVPLNIVLYNVVNASEKSGPAIFGVEPVSYYILNLLLNFNISGILGYLGIIISPLLNIFQKSDNNLKIFNENARLLTILLQLILWSAIFFSQPHKEERFLYPIYPLINLSSSILIFKIFQIFDLVLAIVIKARIIRRIIKKLSLFVSVLIISTISLLRIISLIENYSAPLKVYSHLPQNITDVKENVNVCVGREWYHFPSSFFLPTHSRLKFIKSSFNGLLPGDFLESFSLKETISTIPPNMNNENIFEEDKVLTNMESCQFFIDIDQEVDFENGEAPIIQKSNTGELLIDKNWEKKYCGKLINADESYGIGRLIYIPERFHEIFKTKVSYFNYCLVERKEIKKFLDIFIYKAKGLKCRDRLFLSSRAHLVFDFHQRTDKLKEAELSENQKAIGTTGKGIGPAYSTKVSRSGIRVHHLVSDEPDSWKEFEIRLKRLIDTRKKDMIKPFVVDSVDFIHSALQQKKKILIEGANALMLDIDFGTYPYVTSSNTGIGGVLTGLGIPPQAIRNIYGVVKAYTTRVGEGPFATEQLNEVGEKLQDLGAEFGVTTGRKRRCGWLDLVVLKYSTFINGYTSLNITKLDVLDTFKEIKVAISYSYKGEKLSSFPEDLHKLSKVDVEYVTLPGWNEDITKIRNYEDLPENAKKYLKFIEDYLNVPIQWVGTGPGRESMLEKSIN
ncbi:hypothetical protein PACTADRAFT_79435 [Pachysolen tannophilus NRRL Y-2460]|uniref:Adenylosuccinate synthetase n=1 Tax=Pachysolen tannophilus NRRL Y-2460 TaxID=669874 RepID=A0A1E4TZA4_PACTA|nr:hypothetical protein PACTADRAFT_79435 [Pachysolen tannophilus NRRL Y-2460]